MKELASVMDAVLLPVLASDEDACIVYANEVARRFLGYERAEIVGKWLTDVVAYDPSTVTATVERLKREGHLSGLTRFRRADGSPCEASVNIFGQDLADGTRVFVTLVHPISGISIEMPGSLQAASGYGLNATEMRMLFLLADGFSDQQMAYLLGHTSEEVALGVQGVLAKMNAMSRTEGVVRALKAGIVL